MIGVYDTRPSCLRIVMAHARHDAGRARRQRQRLRRRRRDRAGRPARARIEPACDVWLVATGAEERIYTGSPDHLGALALARRVRARGGRRRLDWALSLDEVGRDRPFWLRSPAAAPRAAASRARCWPPRGARGVPVSWVRDESDGQLRPPRVRAARPAGARSSAWGGRRALPPQPLRPRRPARPRLAAPGAPAGRGGARARTSRASAGPRPRRRRPSWRAATATRPAAPA